ncbi:response regulator transcription factor [Halomonas salifodinae]|uniref:response regulator transcription factor n=1 Tax=Halomonas salifodinae TaxID=438745 RepID=UPI0033AF4CA2
MHIAILDDDPTIREQLSALLTKGHRSAPEEWSLDPSMEWRVDTYDCNKAMLRGLKQYTYHLVLLDWELPDGSGLEVLQWMREYLEVPPAAIMVTHRDSESDAVEALRLGADDFVSKPFRSQELVARVLTVLRRQLAHGRAGNPLDPFFHGNIGVDPQQERITLDHEPIKLTYQEYRLALLLLRNLNRPLTRAYLYESVWGQEENPLSRTLDVHIYRIRKKLGLTADRGWQLASIYGYGYRLQRLDTHT